MKKIILISLFVLFPVITYAFEDSLSTDYPFLRNIQSKCRVAYEPLKGIYFYTYSFLNNISNRGNIWKIKIDISRNKMTKALDTVGLRFSRHWIEHQFRMDLENYGDIVVPVSASKLPDNRWDGWDAGVANGQVIDISVLSPRPKPGESVSGIELTSKGLPGIRRLTIKPWFDEQLFFPAIDDTSEMALEPFSLEKEDSLREIVNYHGLTIGPTAPPINFIPTIWCDTLLSYTRQSVQLGWLKSMRDHHCDKDEKPENGISKNIERRILKAKKELNKGDTVKARRDLETLLKKVERIYKSGEDARREESEHHNRHGEIVMTSEAYALLKYNTEYLIEQLRK